MLMAMTSIAWGVESNTMKKKQEIGLAVNIHIGIGGTIYYCAGMKRRPAKRYKFICRLCSKYTNYAYHYTFLYTEASSE